MSYSTQIGLRYLRSKKRGTVSMITTIAIVGVVIGVAALLVALSITSGFQRAFRDKVLGVNAHVLVLKYGLDFREYKDVVEQAESYKEVEGAAPFLIHEMMLAKGDRLSGVLVKGIDPAKMEKVLDLPRQIVAGSLEGLETRREETTQGISKVEAKDKPIDTGFLPEEKTPPSNANRKVLSPIQVEAALNDLDMLEDDSTASGELDLPSEDVLGQWFEQKSKSNVKVPEDALPGIVIGKTLAEELDISLGDSVQIISPLAGVDISMWSKAAQTPRSIYFKVTGIFQAGFQEYDSRLVYINLNEAQGFQDQKDTVTGVEIRLRDLDASMRIARSLEEELGGPFHTLDWAELNHNLFTALEIQKITLSIVIASIMVVAAFNVIATLILIVMERRKEVSILKAMGATNLTIVKIFCVYGVFIGFVGTVIGLIIGGGIIFYLHQLRFPLDPKVYLIDHLPADVELGQFAMTAIVAFCICSVATIIPSAWAAKLVPAQGLRPS